MKQFHQPILSLTLLTAVMFTVPQAVHAIYEEGKVPTDATAEQLMVATGAVGDNAAPLVAEKSEYTLPYPGILPDHPLYWLKGIRDRILDTLITDPTRQAEFDILQADKRLVMGQALLDKGNPKLAEETISKGTNYLENAVSSYGKSLGSDKPMPGYVKDRLTKSLKKHVELTTELTGKDENVKGSRDRVTELLAQMIGK